MIYEYDSVKDVLLLGAGGHAKVIIDTLRSYYKNISIIGITEKDQSKLGQTLLNVPILGTDDILQDLYTKGLRKVFISLGTVRNYKPRAYLYKVIKKIGFQCINVIHGTSFLSEYVSLGEGNAVLAGAIINTETQIGHNCIINTGSIVEHECRLGNNIHVGPGAKLSGCVVVEDNCFIGIGANIIQGIHIGENSIIGAGSIVINDIPPNSVAVGIPAKVIKKR